MKKARIVKEVVGVHTYYYAQIQERVLFFFKVWSSISYVFMGSGRVSWGKDLGTYDEALKTLNNYEELFGERLNIIP